MNTHSKIIIYDDNCPLCTAYTNVFIQSGLIDKEGRKNFSSIQPDLVEMVNIKRSVNEIPLIDTNTKQVWYGIDALLEILGQKIPILKTAGNIGPINWFLKKLYKLISYNRRVIVAKQPSIQSFDCTPDFNIRYRVIFILLLLAFNSMMLYPVHQYLLRAGIFKAISIQQLQWIHTYIATSGIILAILTGKKKGIEYAGQVNMLVLVTFLLIIPILIINKFLQLHNAAFNNIYLGVLAIFIFTEYTRRMKYAEIIPRYPMVVIINGAGIISLLIYLIS